MTGIEWTDATWNPTTGCDRVSPGCDNCLAPETLVLRADMTWVPISDINVGDRVVSFTDEPRLGQNRVWELATVLAKWETEKPTVEFTLASGVTITASEDHRWLVANRGKDTWWRRTLDLNFKTRVRTIRCEPIGTNSADYMAGYITGATAGDGTFRWANAEPGQQVYWRIAKPARDHAVLDRLVSFLAAFGVDVEVRPFDSGVSAFTDNPLPMAKVETRKAASLAKIERLGEERPTREWIAGWLAGMFDTDASYTGGSLRYCQAKQNDVLDRVVRYGKELGFDLRREFYDHGCPTVRLFGGVPENIAFLGAISPAMTRRCEDFYGKRVEASCTTVTGIRRGGVRRLVDITTSSGTFVAEGALTHNCYAATMARRLKAMGNPKYQRDGDPRTSGPGFGVTVHPDVVNRPLHWPTPRRVFVNSMSDLFHKDVPTPWLADIFAVMAAARWHTFQVLTKRHARMRSVLNDPTFADAVWNRATTKGMRLGWTWPLPNVWLGVSAETQQWADIRIPALLDTPAAVRFVSAEPLLGPIDLTDVGGINALYRDWTGTEAGGTGAPHPLLSWVICGGESGPGARPMGEDWARSLVEQCQRAPVPVFVKQMGAVWARGQGYAGDAKGGDPGYWPDDLRVREFPAEVAR